MSLNSLKPNPGARKSAARVGRGIGSGSGKTAGRGHKGQKARSGGYHKVGFEGGQMPIQRRLPKFGFTSRMGRHYAEVRLHELGRIPGGEVTPATLIEAGIVPLQTRTVKIILSGEVGSAVKVSGCRVTKGARSAIEAAGGSVDDTEATGPAPIKRGVKERDGGSSKGGKAVSAAQTVSAPADAAQDDQAASASSDIPAVDAPAGEVPAADAGEDTSGGTSADDDTPA